MSVAYLFDTDAISHLFKKSPLPAYVTWVTGIPLDDQFTCVPVVAELFAGAFAVDDPIHLERIRRHIIPELTILPFGLREAEVYGRIRSALRQRGDLVADLDLMIGACAAAHGLTLVTGNRQHFERMVPLGVSCCWVLADALADASAEATRTAKKNR